MINWVLDPKWERFVLDVYKSTKFGFGCGIVSHPEHGQSDPGKLVDLYCKFQLAHIIHSPVIIYQLDELSCVGAPLFNIAPMMPVLYNIPPDNYRELQHAVADAPFLVSDKAITALEGVTGLMGSILGGLKRLHEQHGLVVVGMEAEDVA